MFGIVEQTPRQGPNRPKPRRRSDLIPVSAKKMPFGQEGGQRAKGFWERGLPAVLPLFPGGKIGNSVFLFRYYSGDCEKRVLSLLGLL